MFRYFPYWPLFVVLSVICLAIAFFYLQVATPLYEVKATLLIKDEKKGVENSQVVESLNVLESKKIVENEIEVIRSRTLMRETMKKLHLYAAVYEDGLLSPYSAYTTSPVIVEVKDLNELSEAARVDFTYYPTSKTVLFEGKERPLLEWIHSPFANLTVRRKSSSHFTWNRPFFCFNS